MDQTISASPSGPVIPVNHDVDEINLLEYLYALVRAKWLLFGALVCGVLAGYVAAIVKGPEYKAMAVIAPRETESSRMPPASAAFGGLLGGIVANQLNLGGNASLDKIDIILDSRKFNAELIEQKNLLPLLLRKQWDTTANGWKEAFIPPEPQRVASLLTAGYLTKTINKNNTMSLEITSDDSLVSYTILSSYLEYLDTHIRTSVQRDAKENRDYLEEQLIGITDPLLRTKIQELIANEVEKMMVVSKEAFKVIDPVFTVRDFRIKKLYPLIFAAGLFFLVVVAVVFGHALGTSEKTPEDRNLLTQIRHELYRAPFQKHCA